MSEFKEGDVVQLKSGGPAMTINSIDTSPPAVTAYCVWFDKANEEKKGTFPVTSLMPFKKPSAGVIRTRR